MSSGPSISNGSASTAMGNNKPRARLGPTEVVTLPSSDSEPEDLGEDDESFVEVDGESKEDGDFLKDYPEETEDLQLQHLRLKSASIPPLQLHRFSRHLKRLCLRQNEISSPLPAEAFRDLNELEDLDLYDNRLGPTVSDEELKGCPNVTALDLSFNDIRRSPTLPSLRKVHTLYLVQNKIGKVGNGELNWCQETLKSLELGGNRIRVIENLESLTLLEELWLGKNKIRTLENLSAFTSLKILSLQSNRITRIQGLAALVNLEELYLSHNGLQRIEGLESNTKLRTLDISNNTITEIENISHLTELEEFWASNNQISSLRAIDSQLAHLGNLQTVYLEGNPCQKNDMSGYRRKIKLALPQVKQVDATYVKLSEDWVQLAYH